jgi:RNA polymerase sigma-70 factor, ECF subfamily
MNAFALPLSGFKESFMTNSISKPEPWPHLREDEADIVAAAQRNPEAFATLYDRYVQSVYRYLYSRVGSVPEAEDLTAQTFLKALEVLPRYQHRGHFSAWLFSIARSKAIDYFRQRRLASLDDSVRAPQPDPSSISDHNDEIAQLSNLLGALEEDDRELIHLRYVAELSFREMATVLGKNEAAVKKSLYRLLARMQGQLESSHD